MDQGQTRIYLALLLIVAIGLAASMLTVLGPNDELEEVKSFFESFGDRFPRQLWGQHHSLEARLRSS